MTTGDGTLSYASDGPQLDRLRLETLDGEARVIYPAAPDWFVLGNAWLLIVLGLLLAAMFARIAMMLWSMSSRIGSQAGWIGWASIAFFAVAVVKVIVTSGLGISMLRQRREYGRVPLTLIATRRDLRKTWLGVRRLRQKRWDAASFTSVELKVIRSDLLARWKTSAVLKVHRAQGRPLRFAMTSSDAELLTRIGRAVGEALGCDVRVT